MSRNLEIGGIVNKDSTRAGFEEELRRIIGDAGFMLKGGHGEPVSSTQPAAEKA
jgi:hypothetical protein